MWLGQESINCNNLYDFLESNADANVPIFIDSPVGVLIDSQRGRVELKQPGLFRKGEPGTITIRSDEPSNGYYPGDLLAMIDGYCSDSPTGQASITVFIKGMPYWLNGSISIEHDGDSCFYLDASDIRSSPSRWEQEPPKKMDFSGWIGSY